MKKLKYTLIILFIMVAVYLSALMGYSLYVPLNNIENLTVQKADVSLNLDTLQEYEKEEQAAKVQVAKVTPSTKMVYEYYYKDDNITETFEDVPPYFLIDLTRDDMEKRFYDWTVKSFSEKEVIMQKVIEGTSNQYFIIGDYEGYVAVYYENEINGTNLKDITNTPILSLPIEEQEKIKNGIKVVGEDKLIEYISNYES